MIKIALLGSTGSIGKQVLETVDKYPDKFQIVSLSASSNYQLLQAQMNKYKPIVATLKDASLACKITEIPCLTSFYYGENSLLHAVIPQADIVFVAVVGYSGLPAVVQAIKMKKRIALANKETLVAGGQLITALARQHSVDIIPVDSEHSAIFQALNFNSNAQFEKLILTASGGAFRNLTKQQIATAKASSALSHPTWLMGDKITIDCATMMNKGLEVIEAVHLYNTTLDKIQVVVHKQSIIHSMVEFCDGCVMSQMSNPSMLLPITLALTYPERLPIDVPKLNLFNQNLTFERLDNDRFPCFELALQSFSMGDNFACAMNSANEEAVKLYLQDKISFYQINQLIEYAVANTPRKQLTLDNLEHTNLLARQLVKNKFSSM